MLTEALVAKQLLYLVHGAYILQRERNQKSEIETLTNIATMGWQKETMMFAIKGITNSRLE